MEAGKGVVRLRLGKSVTKSLRTSTSRPWVGGWCGKGVCSGEFGKGVPKAESRAQTHAGWKSGPGGREAGGRSRRGVCATLTAGP